MAASVGTPHVEDTSLARPNNSWLYIIIGIMAVVAFVLTDFVVSIDSSVQDDLARIYRIPPSFGDHRLFFGTILALLLSASILSMGAALENVRFIVGTPGYSDEPAKVLSINETLLLLAIAIGFGPDALVLLAWGEAAAPSSSFLARFDRATDGGAALLIFYWVIRRSKSRPVLLFQLSREPFPVNVEPTWKQLRPKMLQWIGIIVVSFGVAFGK